MARRVPVELARVVVTNDVRLANARRELCCRADEAGARFEEQSSGAASTLDNSPAVGVVVRRRQGADGRCCGLKRDEIIAKAVP